MARFPERDSDDYLTGQELVEQLGAWLAARFQNVETYLLERIAQQVAQDLDSTAATTRLAAIRKLQAAAAAAFAELDITGGARRVVEAAIREGSIAALEQLAFTQAATGATLTGTGATGQPLPFSQGLTPSAAIASAQIGLQLGSELDNLAARVIRLIPDVYQQTIAATVAERLIDGQTSRQAQNRAVVKFLSDGVAGFTDVSGRRWRIGTYTEMATRTATNRAWLEAHLSRWSGLGIRLVTIVRGADSCPRCAAWSGKVLSADGSIPAGPLLAEHQLTGAPVTVTVEGSIGDARAGGWNHPNCRCTLAPVFPGLSLPADDSTYDPVSEKNRERLRYLERQVRDAKRKAGIAAAMGDDVTAAYWRSAAREQQSRIREWVAETGLVRKPYRESLSFADGGRAPAATGPRALDS